MVFLNILGHCLAKTYTWYFWSLWHQDLSQSPVNGLSCLCCQRRGTKMKNWRPVTLLCKHLKVLSRALSNRLKGVLENIVSTDQTYCVPERSMMNNIFFNKKHNMNMEILSLDQEKTVDRVDHSHLFSVMTALVLVKGFIHGLLCCIRVYSV